MSDDTILRVEDLKKYFTEHSGFIARLMNEVNLIHAVDGVNFEIFEGEIFGLVGESGCGKSTVGRTILQIYEPTAGSVYYNDIDLTTLSKSGMKDIRKQIQMIFQDPSSSLNRRKTVSQILKEPLKVHGLYKGERDERVNELLETVGIPARYSNRYPHEFSGGQKQRIGIARALAVDPDFIIADEPVSALDVSIQAQILNLLKNLQEEKDLTIIFIAHDLSVIKHICDRVGVMYLGRIVEIADTEELFTNPRHPYTQSLLRSVPQPDSELSRQREHLKGEVPSAENPPPGCSFHPRCPEMIDECKEIDPALAGIEGSPPGHRAACIRADELHYENPGLSQAEREKELEKYKAENFKAQPNNR